MRDKWMFVFLLFLVLPACTTAQFAPVNLQQIYTSRTPPSAIEVFRSQNPTKNYIEVGTVVACCSADANAMMDLLRKKASENGGDAVIGLELNAQGALSATVIRYQ